MSHPSNAVLPTVNARIHPRGGLDILSRKEVARLADASAGGMHDLLRRCALAVLTTGSTSDDPRAAQELYPDFDIQIVSTQRLDADWAEEAEIAVAFGSRAQFGHAGEMIMPERVVPVCSPRKR